MSVTPLKFSRTVAVEAFTPARLEIARCRRGLSARDLAMQVEIRAPHVIRFERGDAAPAPDVLTRLAVALDFPEGWFTGDPLYKACEIAWYGPDCRPTVRHRCKPRTFYTVCGRHIPHAAMMGVVPAGPGTRVPSSVITAACKLCAKRGLGTP